jgi:hypothetical protein
VALSFPILAIAANQWIVRWKGEDRVVPIPNTDYAAPFVDVVILNAQKDMSRVFYKDPYVQNVRGKKPDCWSSNGVKPDDEVAVPVNPVCATCPNSAWGSGGSPAAPKAQACQQRRRTVIVPYVQNGDLTNEADGGPMLLSVPPGSLTNQVKYGQELNELIMADGSKGLFYAGAVTRLSYEQGSKYPKVVFSFVKTLDDDESLIIKGIRTSKVVENILNSKINIDGGEVDQSEGPTHSQSQVHTPPQAPPKAAAPITPKAPPTAAAPKGMPPKPTVVAQPTPAPKPPVGGHPVTGISEAVAKPAAPPASQRTVATAPPVQATEEVNTAPATEDEAEQEAKVVIPGMGEGTVFDNLMSRQD